MTTPPASAGLSDPVSIPEFINERVLALILADTADN
jgi:hypothetical protein